MSVQVTLASGIGHARHVYRIIESPSGNGCFVWKWFNVTAEYVPCIFDYAADDLAELGVTQQHRESLTGLHWPACDDRLREMVQDSGTYFFPS